MICFITYTYKRWFFFKQFFLVVFYHSLAIYKAMLTKTRTRLVTQINERTYSSQKIISNKAVNRILI